MKIEQLRPNICEIPVEEGYKLFEEYYHRRSLEIQTAIEIAKAKGQRKGSSGGKKKSSGKKDQVKVTADKLATLKAMGLIK